MTDSLPVILGGLQLVGVEVPTLFDRTGRMRAVVHHVIGGDRVVQVLGADPQRRQLAGYFIGPQAAESGQLLEAMRDAAQPVILAIGVWTEYVLITSVTIRYADQGSVIPYAIDAEALPFSSNGLVVTTQSIVTALLMDVSQSSNLLVGAMAPSGSIDAVLNGLALATTSITTSYQTDGQLVADLVAPSQSLQGAIQDAGNVLTGVNMRGGDTNLVSGSADLSRALVATQISAVSVRAGGYLNRANSSLLQLSGKTSLPLVHS